MSITGTFVSYAPETIRPLMDWPDPAGSSLFHRKYS
jgi:hypothetical protein